MILVALGTDAQGNKHVLGLREGSTEATRVVRSLRSDLVDRRLDADRARLWLIDGGSALRKAIVDCFGDRALIQRCQEHKRRNVIEYLSEEPRASVGRALRDAWGGANAALAAKQLQRLAVVVAGQAPMGIDGALCRRLRTTNPIENLNGSIAHFLRDVRRWKDGVSAAARSAGVVGGACGVWAW